MAYMYNLTIMLETDVKYHLLDNLGSSGEARSHGSRGVYSSRLYIFPAELNFQTQFKV